MTRLLAVAVTILLVFPLRASDEDEGSLQVFAGDRYVTFKEKIKRIAIKDEQFHRHLKDPGKYKIAIVVRVFMKDKKVDKIEVLAVPENGTRASRIKILSQQGNADERDDLEALYGVVQSYKD